MASTDTLVPVGGFPFGVLASRGLEERARAVATGCLGAYGFLGETLDRQPAVSVLVLSAADWPTDAPPFGMPHYDGRNLVLAGERAGFWKAFVPLVESAAPELRRAAQDVYGPDVDLMPFFDLLAVHELGHAFHQSEVAFPRRWLDELFANLCLHACLAITEPSRLPVLETFPEVLTSIDPGQFEHRDLATFERLYSAMDPLNYGWYQCHLHRAAKRVYDAAGVTVLTRLQRLRQPPTATDDELVDALARAVDPTVAAIPASWPE